MQRIFNIPTTLATLRAQLTHHPEYSILTKPTHWDKVCYLLDLLWNNHIYDRSAKRGQPKQLCSATLAALMGKRYWLLIQRMLTENGIILAADSYQVGSFAKSYQLAEEHQAAPAFCVFNQSSKFADKLAHRNELNEQQRYLQQQLQTVTVRYGEAITHILAASSPMPLMWLQFDVNDADEINAHFEAVSAHINEHPDRNQLMVRFVSIFKLHTRQFFFFVDNKGRRAHTNITNLPTDLRQFLVLDGHTDLLNTDIPASQLVFACIPLIEHYLTIEHGIPRDVARWVELATSGQAYEQLHEIIYSRAIADPAERKEFKGRFFQRVYYCQRFLNEGPNAYPESVAIAKHFPNVMRFILEIKKDDYKHFAIGMQQRESEMVINRFGKQAKTWMLPVLTIHDSVVVPAAWGRNVLQWFTSAFAALDIKIKMTLEPYTAQALRIHDQQYELF
ncbi:hypothetical protein Q5H93_06170 [Hymenobacter sp. ASUV-10]|uniref:DNA-directed DNA polymerase family A palm domain-containing protein n=1 Tax=Hymenobacter aranciens TaxID=3063996 RepID=A0ABT9B7R2_9BACT|nr:hypothetical protein [Hymenobacter sp. ASUV-10]MDO7874311.1 hypothetical protein [Hymenobacter sp. ASUV-10]